MRVFRTLFAAAAAFSGIAQAYKSPMEYEREFAEWLQSHSFSFSDPLEYARRLENYISNDLYILKHNIENMYSGTKLGHNEYSHLSYDEFKSRMLGLALPESYLEKRLAQRQDGLFQDVQVPDEIDWVEKGGVTSVKNQGMCGSCWAFSTTGAVEGATFVSSGTLPSLSEQELVDCDDNGDMGCNGGLMDHAFEWIEDHNGICSEEDYEYQAKKGVCRTCEEVVKVTGYQDVNPNDEHALKVAVAQQPVSIAIEADQRAFQFYKSGVFNLTCGTRLDHGVLAVGYGTDNGQKYWKVKNSWGASWGENGYIRLAREANGPSGQCGIAMAPSYPFATLIKKEETVETKRFEPVKTASKMTQTLYSNVMSSSKITQCGDKDKSIILFDHLEVTPTNPKRGKPVVFFGNGDAKQDIDSASFKLLVTLGGEQVFGHTGVLCGDTHIPLPLGLGHIDVHGFKCPMKKGKFSDLKVDVNLPIIAPEGNYEIQLLSGDSSSDDSLFCVHVTLDLEEDAVVMPKSRVYEPLAGIKSPSDMKETCAPFCTFVQPLHETISSNKAQFAFFHQKKTVKHKRKMVKVTEFKVGMTCEGCSSACTRILTKIDGVTDVKCDIEKQQILVEGDADENVMLDALLKWSKASGKSVALA